MEFLSGQSLVNKSKASVPANEALKEKEIIAFYFSAHWCLPCRMFTPILAEFHEEANEKKLSFEVIFVSSDKSEEALYDYMNEAHGDWYAVPFGSAVINQLEQKFNIQGIPTLIIVKKDGTVVTTNGKSDVEKKGTAVFKDWSQ